jgi:hypothetical protein
MPSDKDMVISILAFARRRALWFGTKEIAERAQLPRGTVTAVLKQLAVDGMVARNLREDDDYILAVWQLLPPPPKPEGRQPRAEHGVGTEPAAPGEAAP